MSTSKERPSKFAECGGNGREKAPVRVVFRDLPQLPDGPRAEDGGGNLRPANPSRMQCVHILAKKSTLRQSGSDCVPFKRLGPSAECEQY